MTNAVPKVTKAKNASTSQSRFESPFIIARLQVRGPVVCRPTTSTGSAASRDRRHFTPFDAVADDGVGGELRDGTETVIWPFESWLTMQVLAAAKPGRLTTT
jgi:hypothetical protein